MRHILKWDEHLIQPKNIDTNIDTSIDTNIDRNIDTNIERNIDTNIERNIDTNIDTSQLLIMRCVLKCGELVIQPTKVD